MVTGAIKNKVDKIWTDIWAGGITNPLTVIEQLTYLMFIRSLDEKELEAEEFDNMTGKKGDRIFPESAIGQSMRWSKFKDRDPREIFDILSQRVFPAIKNMKNGKYETIDSFRNDLFLIFSNCYKYNQPDSVYFKAGKDLEEYLRSGGS